MRQRSQPSGGILHEVRLHHDRRLCQVRIPCQRLQRTVGTVFQPGRLVLPAAEVPPDTERYAFTSFIGQHMDGPVPRPAVPRPKPGSNHLLNIHTSAGFEAPNDTPALLLPKKAIVTVLALYAIPAFLQRPVVSLQNQ